MARYLPKDYSTDPVLLASDFRCAYCGRDLLETLERFVTFARDHVLPRSRGGADVVGNQVAACAACDRLKADAKTRDVEQARRVLQDRRERCMAGYAVLRAAFRTA